MQGHSSRQRGILPLIIALMGAGCVSRTPPDAICLPAELPSPAESGDILNGLKMSVVEGFTDPTPCLILEDLDGDGALDLVVGDRDVSDGLPGLRILWGGPVPDAPRSLLVLGRGATPSAGCTAINVDGDPSLELLVGTEEGTVWIVDGLPERIPEALPASIPLPDEALGVRIVVATQVDLDRAGAPDLILGGSNAPILPCVVVDDDPGGGADVQLQHTLQPEGWLACYVAQEGGGFAPAPDLCPEFPPALYLGAAVGEVQGDGLADVLVVVDFGENRLLLGASEGGLQSAPESAGLVGYNHGMGAVFADLTSRGTSDLYITDLGPDQLYRAVGCGLWEEAGKETGVALATDRTISWGVAPGDLDRDGDLDLVVGNSMVVGPEGFANGDVCRTPVRDVPQFDSLLVQEEGGLFTSHPLAHGPDYGGTWSEVGLVMGDVGGDGDLDIISAESGRVLYRENTVVPAGDYLVVRPVNALGSPVPGATVTVRSELRGTQTRRVDAGTGFSGHHPLEVHLGLGWDDVLHEVRVRWPDGVERVERGWAPGSRHVVPPPPKEVRDPGPSFVLP